MKPKELFFALAVIVLVLLALWSVVTVAINLGI